MVDRTKFPAQGLQGGQQGATGQLKTNGDPAQPKTVLWLQPEAEVTMDLPGGGGFGNPFEREPQDVLSDVVHGYVSIAAALDHYGVVIEYNGNPNALVRLPKHFCLDADATRDLRMKRTQRSKERNSQSNLP